MDHSLAEALQAIREAWRARNLKERTVEQRERVLDELEGQARAAGMTIVTEELVSRTAAQLRSRYSEASWHIYFQPLREICSICGIECEEIRGKPGGMRKKTSVPKRFEGVHEAYLAHLGQRDLSSETVRLKERVSRQLLHFIDDRLESVEDMTSEDVEAFLVEKSQTVDRKAMCTLRSALKLFLEYLVSRHGVSPSAMGMLFEPTKSPPAALQVFLSEDEARRMLAAAACYGPYPKRMLAIVAILIQYGVRSKDIVDLTLDDIDWARNTITFRYTKTGNRKARPLTEGIRYMLLDYMKEERPRTGCPNVFPRMKYPIQPLSSGSALNYAMHRIAENANVEIRGRFGSHVMRRTSATTLMQNDVAYDDISNFLNQESSGTAVTGTTMKYLKVDIERQRAVALEVPRAS